MGSKAYNHFLPREEVVRRAIAYWRDKPGAEDLLADLIAEDEQRKRRHKKKKSEKTGVDWVNFKAI